MTARRKPAATSKPPSRSTKSPADPAAVRELEGKRLELVRDAAAAEAEAAGTLAAKARWLAAEQQVAASQASALRLAGDHGAALRYADQAVKWAQAHAKAIEQKIADDVARLHALVMRRTAAADLLAEISEEEEAT